MSADYKMTRRQAEQEMECFRKVFPVVRLIDSQTLLRRDEGEAEDEQSIECLCYSFWKKEHPCANCTSLKALREKNQRTKLEFLEEDVYQVISRYVEIDNVPYVMELVREMDEDSLIDLAGSEKLVNKLLRYDEKLYLDALTGAYNRRYYEERVKDKKKEAGVAVIDLDDFKLWNDTYGHKAGDAALITIVKTIRKCIRKTDSLIRFGGDEFLLLLEGMNEDVFREKLQQIRHLIHKTPVPHYTQLRLSVSIGGVMAENEKIGDVVSVADKLMYQGKTQKNMVVTQKDSIFKDSHCNEIVDADHTRQRILIVDDSEMNRDLLSEILKDDFIIKEAASGEECMQMLEKYGKQISLVLLDIVMPGMDGFEVLDQMSEKHWIDDIPVIMISGQDSDPYIRRAYELGASDYITRPFDAGIVYRRIQNMLKLYAKQRRLVMLVADQIHDLEDQNRQLLDMLAKAHVEEGKHE